jgi:hypothetical protein
MLPKELRELNYDQHRDIGLHAVCGDQSGGTASPLGGTESVRYRSWFLGESSHSLDPAGDRYDCNRRNGHLGAGGTFVAQPYPCGLVDRSLPSMGNQPAGTGRLDAPARAFSHSGRNPRALSGRVESCRAGRPGAGERDGIFRMGESRGR